MSALVLRWLRLLGVCQSPTVQEQQIAAIAADLRDPMPWLPASTCFSYACRFVARGAAPASRKVRA